MSEAPFILRRQVEFNHCDPAGMVFYPRFFEMISATIERFLGDAVGYGWDGMAITSGGRGTPMGQIDVRFEAPAFLGDWLEFRLTVARIGTASATFTIACHGAEERTFLCHATIVHADTGGGRSVPWPEAAREGMARYLSDDTEEKMTA